jgi:hypothetical protein
MHACTHTYTHLRDFLTMSSSVGSSRCTQHYLIYTYIHAHTQTNRIFSRYHRAWAPLDAPSIPCRPLPLYGSSMDMTGFACTCMHMYTCMRMYVGIDTCVYIMHAHVCIYVYTCLYLCHLCLPFTAAAKT